MCFSSFISILHQSLLTVCSRVPAAWRWFVVVGVLSVFRLASGQQLWLFAESCCWLVLLLLSSSYWNHSVFINFYHFFCFHTSSLSACLLRPLFSSHFSVSARAAAVLHILHLLCNYFTICVFCPASSREDAEVCLLVRPSSSLFHTETSQLMLRPPWNES